MPQLPHLCVGVQRGIAKAMMFLTVGPISMEGHLSGLPLRPYLSWGRRE